MDQSSIKWRLFIDGDDEAYAWLYKNYLNILYKYGLRFTNDPEIVKDCIQDVFTRLYKNRKTLPLPDKVKVFLLVSMKNALLDTFRKNSRYDWINDTTEIPFYLVINIEDEFIQKEQDALKTEQINKILDLLTARQKEVIYYRFIQELEFNDICQLMEMNYQSIHNLIQRSLKKLRESLNPEDFHYMMTLFLFIGLQEK